MHFSLTSTPKQHTADILLFRNVKNTAHVVEVMLEGQLSASLINASLVRYFLRFLSR